MCTHFVWIGSYFCALRGAAVCVPVPRDTTRCGPALGWGRGPLARAVIRGIGQIDKGLHTLANNAIDALHIRNRKITHVFRRIAIKGQRLESAIMFL